MHAVPGIHFLLILQGIAPSSGYPTAAPMGDVPQQADRSDPIPATGEVPSARTTRSVQNAQSAWVVTGSARILGVRNLARAITGSHQPIQHAFASV